MFRTRGISPSLPINLFCFSWFSAVDEIHQFAQLLKAVMVSVVLFPRTFVTPFHLFLYEPGDFFSWFHSSFTSLKFGHGSSSTTHGPIHHALLGPGEKGEFTTLRLHCGQ
jgi:hypothetical protein